MKVLYVYHGDWPRNATRVVKQTRALAEAGHDVRLLSGNPRGEPRLLREGWMEIERVPRLGSADMNRLLAFPVFANPFWIYWIRRAAQNFRPDAIIVRDLPLAPAVLMVGQAAGVSVHYEMADVYPVSMRANRADHPGIFSRITRHAPTWDRIDRYVIRHAASVFVVSEESRDRCIALGAHPASVVIVGNTLASLPALDQTLPPPEDIADWTGRPLVCFIGNLFPDRGLLEAVDAIDIVRTSIPDIAFVIAGDGPMMSPLVEHVARKGLSGHVRFVGWKGASDHAAYYQQAAIGVLPFLSTEHIDITLANKLFDYMGARLAVIGSDGPPMRRVIEETGAGVIVPPGDRAALAAAIVSLLRDPARRRALGDRGRAAVSDRYSWSRDRARFLDAIIRFTKGA